MFLRQKPNKSGSTSVVVVSKSKGKYKVMKTLGVSADSAELEKLIYAGKEWILKEKQKDKPELDLFGTERQKLLDERIQFEYFISNISNILINGTQLILDKVFNKIGFNTIKDYIFRQLVESRLCCPSSKAATVDYLKNHFDEDVNLSKIYRYLDHLNSSQGKVIQDISIDHTKAIFNGKIGALFYDVTTLYFETDKEDDLRIRGFSKEGKHNNPQIILGLLVSQEGYPLAYCIHEGNKYEGHTMLPVVETFVKEHQLKDFVIVADSGLMTETNLREFEKLGYKYIIGARIKNESKSVVNWILEQPKVDKKMVELAKSDGRKLLIGYTDARANKDAYNRQKGLRRLEKMYAKGTITKDQINKKGYNKYLELDNNVNVTINYEKVKQDASWDGLKGYITNTDLPKEAVYASYHNLWQVEQSFRIAKSKLEIRPMFHFTKDRIEAHVSICFAALKVYKELERILKLTDIKMSVDKVLNMAKTITTIQIELPENKEVVSKTMIMKRHKKIEKLFNEDFWVSQ